MDIKRFDRSGARKIEPKLLYDQISYRSQYFKIGLTSYVSNSGPRAKFGPKCNPNWPARSYQICIRAGPWAMLYLCFNFNFSCFVIPIFFLPDSAFMRNSSLFLYEKVKHCISVVVNFSMDIEYGPWLYFTA